MKTNKAILILISLCLTLFIFIHRRVIKSLLTGSPMPESPHKCHGRSEDGDV